METNWDSAVTILLILVVAAVAFGVLFRHKLKVALKGPGGVGLDVEGENAPDRPTAERTQTAAAPGERSVSVGTSADGATITTGDHNRIERRR